MIKFAKLMRKKPGDKGFTLIELIIVIAILAALIAILAPQYLKYVEKSRVTADETTGASILQAVQVATSDPDIAVGSTSFTVTWSGAKGDAAAVLTYAAGTAEGATAPSTAFQNSVNATIGSINAVKSTEYSSDKYVVTVSVDTNGNPTISGEFVAK